MSNLGRYCNKAAYLSREVARQSAKIIARKYTRIKLFPYYCPACFKYHLTKGGKRKRKNANKTK